MSLLHDDAFLAHLSQSKSEAKQQVNSMIDAIYAKVLLDLELWLNKDKDRNDSVHGLGLNHNDATDEQMKSMSTNTQQMHENVNCPPSLHPSHLQTHSNHFSIKTEDDEFEVDLRVIQFNSNEKLIHLDSVSNPKQSSQSQPMTIKEEIDSMPVRHVQSSLCAPVSNEQSNHNLTDQHSNNHDECDNSQIKFPHTQMQSQPQQLAQLAHIKHNQFDNEECDCDECVDGGIEVKEENGDDNDEYDELDEESSRPVKRQRMGTTQSNNAQKEVSKRTLKQSTDEAQSNEDKPEGKGEQMGSGQSEDNEQIDNGEVEDDGDDEDTEVDKETNSIGEESISTECTCNPIQSNLAQSNRHLQCSFCPKSFGSNSKLQRHLRVHTGERPFQCDLCDKRFKERYKLTRHQLIHQNVKHFQCDQCGKQFTRKDHLDVHLIVHSGERPFACLHCEKSFTTSENRKKHEQSIHLNVKPYRCKQCGHTVSDRAALIRHIREVHFGLPRSIKQQRALNIIDDRDPRELVEKV